MLIQWGEGQKLCQECATAHRLRDIDVQRTKIDNGGIQQSITMVIDKTAKLKGTKHKIQNFFFT